VLEVAASGQFVLGSCSAVLGMTKAQGLALAGDFAVERKGFVHTYQAVRFEQANESSVLCCGHALSFGCRAFGWRSRTERAQKRLGSAYGRIP
jgi:hypothetical protein